MERAGMRFQMSGWWKILTASLLASSVSLAAVAHAAPLKVAGLTPSGGHWTLSRTGIEASDVSLGTNLTNQYAYEVNHFANASLLSVRVMVKALPKSGVYTVGLVDHSAANGNGQYKWSLDLTNRGLELINDGFQVVSRVPYHVSLHRWISMELLVSDNVLDGKVWTGHTPPANWQITGRFFRGLARTQPDAGLYAAHADVTFQHFVISPLQTTITAVPRASAAMFMQGQPVGYQVSVNHQGVKPLSLRVVAHLMDANGHAWMLTHPVVVPANGKQQLPLPLPEVSRPGWYGVQYNLVDPATGQVLESLPQMGLAVIPPPLTPGSRRLGMNISVVSWYLPPAVRRQDIALEFSTLADQGMQALRLEFNTNLLPNWTIYDPMMVAAHNHGMQVLGILDSWPTGKNPFVPANHISFQNAVKAYLTQVKAIVNRYRPGGILAKMHGFANTYGIRDWEIWNEPSIPSRWGGSMTQYGELVKATAKVVRSIEPHAFLLEYAHHDQTVYRASGDSFNGLAIHYYPGRVAPENSKFPITDAVSHNLNFLRQAKLPPILWMTEVGWNTQLVSPMTQAAYLVRASLESLNAGTGPVYLFIQNFLNSGMGDQHLNFTPKPAFSALLTEARMIRGYRPDETWTHGSYQAELWTSGSHFRLMLWNVATGSTTTRPPQIAGMQKVNWMGDLVASPVVSVGPRPIYLTVMANPGSSVTSLHQWFNGV